MPSEYRFSRPLAARMMGFLLAGLGVVVFLVTVLVAGLSLPTEVLAVTVLFTALTVLVGGFLLTRKASVVRLSDTGYQVRFVRGAGVSAARWTDVEDVVTTTVAGERCVVLRLRDGGSTTIPVRVLAARPDDFVRDLQDHLNRGHGYRRLN